MAAVFLFFPERKSPQLFVSTGRPTGFVPASRTPTFFSGEYGNFFDCRSSIVVEGVFRALFGGCAFPFLWRTSNHYASYPRGVPFPFFSCCSKNFSHGGAPSGRCSTLGLSFTSFPLFFVGHPALVFFRFPCVVCSFCDLPRNVGFFFF